MKYDVLYDGKSIPINIPDAVSFKILSPNSSRKKRELGKSLLDVVLDSTVTELYSKSFVDNNRLLVIVNDGTRPTPTSLVIEALAPIVAHENVKFLVATGAHRSPTENELKRIFGPSFKTIKDRVFFHDARMDVDMRDFGVTTFGTEVAFHYLVSESDVILVIGSVEPHYFAGYTGGRKGLLPGVSAYRTIEQNHKLALSEKAYSLNLKDNPVHADMVESLKFLQGKKLLGIMAVLEEDHRVSGWFSGDLDSSFNEASSFAKDVFGVPIKERADIVITAAQAPMDINLYQSQKALDNAKLAVKDNGIIIFISACKEGIGDESFANLLCSSASLAEVQEKISSKYVLGYHKAAKMAQIFENTTVYAMTGIDDERVHSMFMNPIHDVEKILHKLFKELHDTPTVYLMPDGGMTIPVVK